VVRTTQAAAVFRLKIRLYLPLGSFLPNTEQIKQKPFFPVTSGA